jgi:hypothetical protein
MGAEQRACSWDSEPHPRYNSWTIAHGLEAALAGVVRPLSADLIGRMLDLFAHGIAGGLGAGDAIELAGPPGANLFGVFGGRWAMNLAWRSAYCAALSNDRMLASRDDTAAPDESPATIASNHTRTRPVAAVSAQPWAQAVSDAHDQQAVATAWRRDMLTRDLVPVGDAELLDLIERTIRLCADLLVTHGHVIAMGDACQARLLAFIGGLRPGQGPGVAEVLATLFEQSDDGGPGTIDPAVADQGSPPPLLPDTISANAAVTDDHNPAGSADRTQHRRSALEAQIIGRLSQKDGARFRLLLTEAYELGRARELSRLNWVIVGRALRPPLLEFGGRMQRLGLIAERDDVFFLRWTEVQAATRDELHADLAQQAITERKGEYAHLQPLRLPETFSLPTSSIAQPSAGDSPSTPRREP